ncbi:putative transcriptional regulator protein, LysR family (plasmid) [Rhizobium etli CIAT 652]|uniref:HTH-type transcriptional regulator TtuA n=1 Tax=Rhizobium etli (strain CIAT 652) TaxID=491916 RepID=B3Q439_RHIE6|nr:putative transcriptional regulator protein, LysR family [Rhizobium etli CIAT 652]
MTALEDLNDLMLFAAVVHHGSFSAAALAHGLPKSKVSRRVAGLERRLGVRLLQRSTRALHVTEVGQALLPHCESMAESAQAALEVAASAGEHPSGRLKVSCPIGVAHIYLAPVLGKFLKAHPAVRFELDLTNRRVDVIAEGYDVALRIRSSLDDSNLVVRSLGTSEQMLVASPEFIATHGPFGSADSLQRKPGVGPAGVRGERNFWSLLKPDGVSIDIEYLPTLMTDDVYVLCQAALAGIGVARLPVNICGDAIRDGRLVKVLPHYRLHAHGVHAVFPSRRGLVPAVRAFLDFLAEELPGMLAAVTGGYDDGYRPGSLGSNRTS